MQKTKHMQQRMNQRGIPGAEVQAAITYGRIDHDKYFLGRKEIDQELRRVEKELKVLKRVRDKGGVVVVMENNTLITSYRVDSFKRRKQQ